MILSIAQSLDSTATKILVTLIYELLQK